MWPWTKNKSKTTKRASPQKEKDEKMSNTMEIEVGRIMVDRHQNIRTKNYEDNPEKWNELKAQIKERGIIVPVIVGKPDADGNYPLLDGFRRMGVTAELIREGVEIKAVPASIREGNEAEMLVDRLICGDGVPFDPIEQAAVIYKLRSYKWKDEEIARKCGRSAQWVKNTRELLDQHPEVIESIKAGKIAASEVQRIHREVGGDKAITREVIDAGIKNAVAAGENKLTKAQADSTLQALAASGAIPPTVKRTRGATPKSDKAKAAAKARAEKLAQAKKSPKAPDLILFFEDCAGMLRDKSPKVRARVYDLLEFVGTTWRLKFIPFKHEEEEEGEGAE